MRLRSSQFVFLMLLVCSVQVREEYALHMMTGVVSGRIAGATHLRETAAAYAKPDHLLRRLIQSPAQPTQLDSASAAAHRAPWTMRNPALEATALVSFTSFLRA
jgi:hypothetical protein